MNKYISAVMKRIITILKLGWHKLFCWSKLRFGINESFSLATRIIIHDSGRLVLGNRCSTNGRVEINVSGGGIVVGEGTFFNNGCMIVSRDMIKIGDNCMFGPNTMIYDHDHDYRTGNHNLYKVAPVTIGKNVWCGANVVILRGVTIGDNCVIAAGSVVKESIPKNTLYYEKKQYNKKKI